MIPTKPTLEHLRAIAQKYNMHIRTTDLRSYLEIIDSVYESYHHINQFTAPPPPIRYQRTGSYTPPPEENPLNAWYQKCSIKGAAHGLLQGKRIALNDTICLAEIPMMIGSMAMEGYIPDSDATIVSRILDAGGEIVGKAVCENMGFAGSSFTAATGPILNPHRAEFSAGGSSSGSAALVVAGECDMAIGGDQGGSISIPACWCGAYGLKPTYGLVPYTGIFPIEMSLDHIGPIAATTKDAALLLEVIAGDNGLDPRQKNVRTERYTQALCGNTAGIRIGIVREGFAWPKLSEPEVDTQVEYAALRFSEIGSCVSTISIPIHREGKHIWLAIFLEGAMALLMHGNGMGTNWRGGYTLSLQEAVGLGRNTLADTFFDTLKLTTLLGHYMRERYYGRYYTRAQNLARVLAQAYDEALQTVDLLVMPTTPMKATRFPSDDASAQEKIILASQMNVNSCPFTVTGHPVITVPCGLVDGLPIGIMLIGRMGEDATVLRAAHAFEQISDYTVRMQGVSSSH